MAANWRQMEGANMLEKKLNAFLTSFFVTGTAPKDECIRLVKRIIKLKKPSEENIREELKKSFGMGSIFDKDGNETAVDLDVGSTKNALDKGALIVYYLIKFS